MNKFKILGVAISVAGTILFQRCKLEKVVVPPLAITILTPSAAHAGDTVSIIGKNFISGRRDRYKISIGGVPIDTNYITEIKEDVINFRVPVGIGSGKVTITSDLIPGLIATSIDSFTYYYTATKVETFAGTYGLRGCEGKAPNCLNYPMGIALDENKQYLIVADNGNNLIHKIPLNKNDQEKILGVYPSNPACSFTKESKDESMNVYFKSPYDVEVDSNGDIYVAEDENHTIRVLRKGNGGSGEGRADIIAGDCSNPGYDPGQNCLRARSLTNPVSLFKDNKNLYFSDNGIIRVLELNDVGNCNSISNISGNNISSQYFTVLEVSHANNQGPIFIGDRLERKIKAMSIDGKTSDVVTLPSGIFQSIALTIDEYGNIFIAANNTIYVYYYATRELITLAGTGDKGYTPDSNAPLSAKFNNPLGLALFEKAGVLFVADTDNNVIRKVTFQ
ncbi:MAG: IPT/TIG domain-containing protein [Ferruginibacter sp.]